MLSAGLDDLASHLAADVPNLALQVTNSSFAGVIPNHFGNRVIFEDDIFLAQSGSPTAVNPSAVSALKI